MVAVVGRVAASLDADVPVGSSEVKLAEVVMLAAPSPACTVDRRVDLAATEDS